MNKIARNIIAIGLLLVIIGFIYDMKFAGIPYQDPPIELQIKYNRNQKIANWIMDSGVAIFVVGLIIRLTNYTLQKIKTLNHNK